MSQCLQITLPGTFSSLTNNAKLGEIVFRIGPELIDAEYASKTIANNTFKIGYNGTATHLIYITGNDPDAGIKLHNDSSFSRSLQISGENNVLEFTSTTSEYYIHFTDKYDMITFINNQMLENNHHANVYVDLNHFSGCNLDIIDIRSCNIIGRLVKPIVVGSIHFSSIHDDSSIILDSRLIRPRRQFSIHHSMDFYMDDLHFTNSGSTIGIGAKEYFMMHGSIANLYNNNNIFSFYQDIRIAKNNNFNSVVFDFNQINKNLSIDSNGNVGNGYSYIRNLQRFTGNCANKLPPVFCTDSANPDLSCVTWPTTTSRSLDKYIPSLFKLPIHANEIKNVLINCANSTSDFYTTNNLDQYLQMLEFVIPNSETFEVDGETRTLLSRLFNEKHLMIFGIVNKNIFITKDTLS